MTPELRQDAPPAEPLATADRGVSPVAGPLAGRRGRWISLAALAVGCGVFLAATWDRGEADAPPEPASQTGPRELAPFEPARRDAPRLADAARDPAAPRLAGDTAAAGIPALEPAGPATAPPPAAPAVTSGARQALAESARRAPVLAYSRSGRDGPASSRPGSGGPGPATAAAHALSALDALRQAAPVAEVRAGRLPDRNLLLTAGTALPCILQTALDSGAPGYVSCVAPNDVYSDNGAVVLLERGTRVLGEYRGGLQQGRRRLFVLWTRAVTPSGVTIALASPAADALGRSGFDGQVDTRFWDRFGGALLLSIVDDGAYAALGEDAGAGAARLPSDAAAVALQGSVDIPPTLRKAQGSEVSILVAQDLNFADVYGLRAR